MSRRSLVPAYLRTLVPLLALAPLACKPDAPLTPQTVTILGADYAFSAPDTIHAGLTTVQLVNNGPSLHHATLVRLDSGKTFADLMGAFQNPGPPPAWARFVAGPNPGAPGDTTAVTVGLEAGHYAIICLVPDSLMVPHIAHGMSRALEVVAHDGPDAPEPVADVELALTDYAFTFSADPQPGMRTIKVVNNGPQPHEVFIARLDSGATAAGLLEWIGAGMHGRPPAYPMGGTTTMDPGTHAFLTANLTPGTYALLCFVPDATDGREHFQHGMMRELHVGM